MTYMISTELIKFMMKLTEFFCFVLIHEPVFFPYYDYYVM